MQINGKTIEFKQVQKELLSKTPYSEQGIHNVMKSIASEFIMSDKNDFLVYIKANENVFHLVRNIGVEEITVELKDIYKSDVYLNSGLITENITRKNIGTLH